MASERSPPAGPPLAGFATVRRAPCASGARRFDGLDRRRPRRRAPIGRTDDRTGTELRPPRAGLQASGKPVQSASPARSCLRAGRRAGWWSTWAVPSGTGSRASWRAGSLSSQATSMWTEHPTTPCRSCSPRTRPQPRSWLSTATSAWSQSQCLPQPYFRWRHAVGTVRTSHQMLVGSCCT